MSSKIGNLSALIVEDEEFLQKLFALELTKRGFQVYSAHSIHETMKILYNKKIHLDFCLLDRDLPDGSGLNLLAQMKLIRSDMPVIMMTGQGGPSIFKAAMHGGAFDYIEKPFSIEKDVLPIIQRLSSQLVLKLENNYLTDQILHNSKLAALGELSATVVHDIRGPLAMIQVTCEDLSEEFEEKKSIDQESLNQHLAQIGKACAKIKKLVDHLRNYARNDINETQEPKKIVSLIDDSLFMVEQKVRKIGVQTSIDIELSLKDAELICFPNKFEQVLMNLMSNACDAMQNMSIKKLSVHVRSENGFLLISIQDTGCGIPEAIQPRIFESFYTTKSKLEGTGLGLSIVRNIIKEHEGDLILKSKEGEGTTFTIKLKSSNLILNSEPILEKA